MSKDRDYIKAMFDSDGIKAPESLSEENMLAMLEAAETAEAKETEQQSNWKPAKPAAEKKHASWKPAPTIATFLGLLVGTILYLLCCIVEGVRAQRASWSESNRGCVFAVCFDLAKLKQALWHLMQGLISSSRPSLSLVTQSGSTRF